MARRKPTPPTKNTESNYPQYKKRVMGVVVDPYRILAMYKVADPGVQHAVKKLLRAGHDHNSWAVDVEEARDSLNRSLEMHREDEQGLFQ